MIFSSFRRPALIGALFAVAISSQTIAQPGLNSGKPIITYNTSGPRSIETQSPPAFPGGEERLVEFIRASFRDAEQPVKLGRKTWITATINGQGKVTSLAPSFDNDPSLKKSWPELAHQCPAGPLV